MNTVVLYHANCNDGFSACMAAFLHFNNRAEYLAVNYGEAPPQKIEGSDVFIVDFSYKRPTMLDIASRARNLVVLDHHETARDELRDFPRKPEKNVDIRFDMNKSGAVMTWEYFHPESPVPDICLYAQAYDLGGLFKPASEMPVDVPDDLEDYHFGITMRPFKIDEWRGFFDYNPKDGKWYQNTVEFERVMDHGRVIKKYFYKHLDVVLQKPATLVLNGMEVPVVNAPYFMASHAGNRLALESAHGIGATYIVAGDKVLFSLRSIGDTNVAEIAKTFGGGGHKNAAGFSVNISEFQKMLK